MRNKRIAETETYSIPPGGEESMRASVVLTTYNSPKLLEKSLWAFAQQADGVKLSDFEIVVADDGSTSETRELCSHMAQRTGLVIQHVWHEDRGFRKCRILNQAVLAAQSEYLIFSDGDCLPRRNFVATHLRHAKPGHFLSGGRVCLPEMAGSRLDANAIRAGAFADVRWLRKNGVRLRRDSYRLLLPGWLERMGDRLTTTRATFNGHNASAWLSDLLRVNGFNEAMGYGGLDRELGERLVNAGVKPLQIRHQAVCVHVDHPRGYVDPNVWAANIKLRQTIRAEGVKWTEHGIHSSPTVPLPATQPTAARERRRAA